MATIPEQLKQFGFGYDVLSQKGYRVIEGFGFIVHLNISDKMYTLRVPCAVRSPEEAAQMNGAVEAYLRNPQYSLKSAGYDGRMISMCYATKNMVLNLSDNLGTLVELCMNTIRQFNAVPVCGSCGRADNLSVYGLENRVECLCPQCFSDARSKISEKVREQSERVENVPLGVVGAVMGGAAGAVIWLLFSLMGKIVFVAGMAAAVASFFAYRRLAKKVSKLGLILSLVIGFVMMLIGMYFAIGLDVFNGLKDIGAPVSFGEALKLIPDYIRLNTGAVLFNNIFGVLTYIGGAVICVMQYRNDNKIKGRAVLLASDDKI